MDLLKNQNGFSLIEVLVAILLLGLLVTFTALFFNNIFNNRVIFLKNEALNLANLEMNISLSKSIISDTNYTNIKNNLLVEKQVLEDLKGYNIIVNVYLNRNKDKNIVSLSCFKAKRK